jgi:NitT/TauT family transport system permease protein
MAETPIARGETLGTVAASAATLAVALAAWEALVRGLALSPQVLPGPGLVAQALWQGWVGGTFWPHIAITLQGALGGCLIGSLLGFLTGVAVAGSRRLRLALYPVVIAIQSMPTVAVAPLIVVYFGVGLPSKLVTVALLCFFPLFVNTVAGLQAADARLVDLYRASSASRWRVLVDVRIPGCVPSLLAGLQVAVVLSFIGCVVSEFVASRAGLGHLIKTYSSDLNVAVMFACVVSLAVLGGGTGYALNWLRERVRLRLRL